MIFYHIYLHGRLQIISADHSYACEWIDRYKRKLGIDHSACHVEAELTNLSSWIKQNNLSH